MNDDTISHGPQAPARRTHGAAPSTISRVVSAWSESAAAWVKSSTDACGLTGRGDAALHSLADYLRHTRDPEDIQHMLVHLLHQISGAERVELHRSDSSSRSVRPVAGWPEPSNSQVPTSACVPLCLPVSLGGRTWGQLHLWGSPRRGWSPRLVRRLTTLATMAAGAERAARACRGAGTATPFDPITGLYNEPFLAALLTHGLAQARRRREPLALLCVGLDPLPDLGPRLGREISQAALQRMAQAIVGTLRASDTVARRDDDRLVVLLPAADSANALVLGEEVRRAVAEAGLTSSTASPLTASLGVAGYPDHSDKGETLLAMAVDALARAQSQGGNRVAAALRLEKTSPFRIAAPAC
jgi:diguanylate cyclase (GGDEF)-like protein